MTFHGGRGRGRRRPGFGSDEDEPDLPPPDPVEEQKRAKEICFTQLAAQPRTRLELKNAMLRKGIAEELAELVLGKFDKAGLIDDAAFAEIWVRSRHTYNGLGRRALAMELKRKGVADDLVTEAVAAVDDEAEQDRARELVRKKLRGMAGVDETAKIRRLVGALARKGYAGGMAYQVVREELRAAGEDAALLDDALPD
ncbi:MAG TPA: regulatory protein RecX [Umezawaea sp.]|nr:regulatory protein RecX [Umezawaea sp.]